MPLSAVDAISPAFQHTEQQLVHPFRFGQWVRLAFVGALAGESASFGGCNFNYNPSASHASHRGEALLAAQFPPQLSQHWAMAAALIALLVVVGVALAVLFTYIASVMRFILFDSVVTRQCRIRENWTRRKQSGFQLFVWELLLMLASFAAVVIVLGIPALYAWRLGWFANPSEHWAALISAGVAVFLIFIALIFFLALVQVMTKDFVVPQMALENIDAFEGWRRLLPQLNAEKGGYAGYIGMKIVLTIGAAIAFGLATIFVLILLLIPFGGVALAAVLVGSAMGLTWNVLTIAVAVIYCCFALIVFLFVAFLISVPIVVFFPAYSIYFFAPRFPPLAALIGPAPPAPTDSSPPSAPPPLPLAPEPLG
ncbi:MAG TPA: hypothetical protein VMB47_04865 [Candidatus Aquilonibacter sp.]|nr:hypothetical protein [Candidatus Aquilonibacter sp.]